MSKSHHIGFLSLYSDPKIVISLILFVYIRVPYRMKGHVSLSTIEKHSKSLEKQAEAGRFRGGTREGMEDPWPLPFLGEALYVPCYRVIFLNLFPKPCRSAALVMIKITTTVPWYYLPTLASRNSWCHTWFLKK